MTSKQTFSVEETIDNSISEDEIDLKQVFDLLYRNKRLIAKFILSGLILSGLHAFNTKKVWQGEFQIVLETSEPKTSLSLNSNLANLAGLGNEDDELEILIGGYSTGSQKMFAVNQDGSAVSA